MKHRVKRTLANPLLVVIPLVAVLLLGWREYVQNGRDLSLPAQNILPGGAFDTFGSDGRPTSWAITKTGSLRYHATSGKGYVSGKLFSLHIDEYHSGSLAVASAKVPLEPHKTYLYKGYYQTTAPFDLLARYYYADGSSQLRFVRAYTSGEAWSTASTAFQTGDTVRAVQFVYRLASEGTLKLDETYLEEKSTGVYIPPVRRDTNAWIPNADLSRARGAAPDRWSPYHTGKNRAAFRYIHKPGQTAYVSARLTKYKTGEAKWQYRPQAVAANQAFTFGVTYRSSARSLIVAEYVLKNGKHQFETLATLTPAGEWTRYQTQFEAPKNAASMFVSAVLKSNGTLDTAVYALRETTRPGARHFQRPLVSIAFDDGWRSADQNALPILDAYSYKGTFYLNPSSLRTTDFIGQKQVDKLVADGHEIGSHGFSHVDMTSVNAGQLDSQLKNARHGYDSQDQVSPADFATPYGRSDAEVQFFARRYYRSLRGTDSGVNTRQNFDPYDIKVLYIAANTPEREIRQALVEAKASYGWLVLVYHRVQTTGTKPTGAGENTIVTPQRLTSQLRLIQQSGISVKTVAAALDELQKQL